MHLPKLCTRGRRYFSVAIDSIVTRAWRTRRDFKRYERRLPRSLDLVINDFIFAFYCLFIPLLSLMQCKDLLKKGATKCSTPSEVVNQCDITFACVSDAVALKDVSLCFRCRPRTSDSSALTSPILLQVVFGGKGVLQAITEGKGFVNLSTVDTETTMDVAEVSEHCEINLTRHFLYILFDFISRKMSSKLL